MNKRKWTNIELFESEIIRLREAGMTRQLIADELFLEKVQIKNWINRYKGTLAPQRLQALRAFHDWAVSEGLMN